MIVSARDPDAQAFEPYGVFLTPPTEIGVRNHFNQWLEPVPGLSQHSHINRVAASPLPVTVGTVEYHPHAAQLFLPIGVSRYLVTVMPEVAPGTPDPDRSLSFVVPGTVGVAYHPGTWHSGITVLDTDASFAVLMWRGADDDDVFAHISPLEIRAEDVGAGARRHA